MLLFRAMAQHLDGALRNGSRLRPDPRCKEDLWYALYTLTVNQCRNKTMLTLNFMLRENAPWIECIDKSPCFLLKHRAIIATAYWILFLKPSLVLWQGQRCLNAFHELMSSKTKRPILCVKPKLTPLYFHSLHVWYAYAWLLYYTFQQFFYQCVKMHECNNNFGFCSHSSIFTSILNIHVSFPIVYINNPYI